MFIKKVLFTAVFLGSGIFSYAAASGDAPIDTSDYQSFLKSFNLTEDEFQARIGSTRMFGGSSPVSFSGEGRVKAQYHLLDAEQEWMAIDRSYIQTGWEGNESMIRMGMVARAGRNTVLYSKIGFQNTLPGIVWNRDALTSEGNEGSSPAQTRHDKSLVTANIHEDMSAGLAIRTVPASFWLRMGNINWVEASPLTIWKSQPRTFAWEFLPFEIEQPIARYYEYNIAKGEKAGRAAWHKKPFNGICLESINLPANLYLDVLYATYERYDNYEREYVDFAGDRAYVEGYPVKGSGIGDSYRHIFHARLATMKIFGDMSLGLNFNRLDYIEDVFTSMKDNDAPKFLEVFKIAGRLTDPKTLNGRGFYKEPMIFSVDLRGPMANKLLELHSDLAFSRVDTTFLTWRTFDTLPDKSVVPDSSPKYEKTSNSSKIAPAFVTKLAANTIIPFQLDIAAIAKGFYSPFSFVAPNDAFYAFGSNLVGSGKFLSRHEASPYAQNMAGALLSITPKLSGYGHLRFAYGQHFQLEEGRNVLYIPYRLNGLDLSSFFHSSYDRWGSGPVAHSSANGDKTKTYKNRAGDESFKSSSFGTPTGLEGGGLYNDYLSMMECFVAYDDPADVRRNDLSFKSDISYTRTLIERNITPTDTTIDTLVSTTGFVPVSRKFTNNIEVDFSYDISDMIGYPNNLFIGGYFALNNVASALTPVALSAKGDKVQLWSSYFRFEPAIALTKKFYVLGLFGYENWRSEKAWMSFTKGTDRKLVEKYLSAADLAAYDDPAKNVRYFNVPIDYKDIAYGIGFDWELLARVGLHARVKQMSHVDENYTKNNWSTPIASLEIKTWF